MAEIIRLDTALEDEWEEAVRSTQAGLLYYSVAYRRFLDRILDGTHNDYLAVREAGRIVAVIPLFTRVNPQFGNVMNSLPFYGSNGGPLLAAGVAPDAPALRELAAAFQQVARDNRVAVSTVISNPLAPPDLDVGSLIPHSMEDERIGQVTPLPPPASDAALSEALMASFHSKTRNIVRKALSGVIVSESDTEEDLRLLASMHQENIGAMGGLAKPWPVFEAIRECFKYGRDYRLYKGSVDGRTVAGLLVFFYNSAAEYFVPASDAAYRSHQPMSALIFHAMRQAVRQDCRWWNWGGTWLTQSGVYHFKSRWGTQDRTYRYYITEYEGAEELRSLGRATILAEYPSFYVLPFSRLVS